MKSASRPQNLFFSSFALLLVLSCIGGLIMISRFLLAIIMGGILAILLKPLHKKFEKWHFGQKKAAGLIIILIIVVCFGPLSFFVARAVNQGIGVAQNLSKQKDFSIDNVIADVSQWEPVQVLVGDTQALETKAKQFMGAGLTTVSAGILTQLGNIPEFIVQFATMLFVCYFLLIQGKQFTTWAGKRVPLDPETKKKIALTIQGTSVSVVWATILAGLSQATVIAIGFLVLGIPSVFLAAGATFIFAWIPLVGCSPVWLSAIIYLYTQGAYVKMILMFAIGLFAGIIDNIVRPLVLKGRGEMHPAVSLIAIFGGIATFGIVGVFVGPIIAAMIIAILRVWPDVAGIEN